MTIGFPFCGGGLLRIRTECFAVTYCTHSSPLGLFRFLCSTAFFRTTVLFVGVDQRICFDASHQL